MKKNISITEKLAISTSGSYKKIQLLVSVSGGETSMYMAWWLWTFKRNEYEMVFVFSNTGQENEETLEFVKWFEEYFGIPITWIEARVHFEFGKGNTFSIVNFETADRSGRVFEDVIKKHGIPNQATPHCSRELKSIPIKAYAKSIGWKKYYLAIGIRTDEFDRMNSKKESLRLLYPLISMKPMTKPKINFWWSQQARRLNLKGYQGNCKWCWKKGERKLIKIAQENPQAFIFPSEMEHKYGDFVPENRLRLITARGEKPNLPTRFFRKNKSVQEIVNDAVNFRGKIVDDAANCDPEYDLFDLLDDTESCEVFSNCGSDDSL